MDFVGDIFNTEHKRSEVRPEIRKGCEIISLIVYESEIRSGAQIFASFKKNCVETGSNMRVSN